MLFLFIIIYLGGNIDLIQFGQMEANLEHKA